MKKFSDMQATARDAIKGIEGWIDARLASLGWGWPIALCAIVSYLLFQFLPKPETFEILANTLLICGALVIAKGVALSETDRTRLFAIVEAKHSNEFAHRTDLLLIWIELAKQAGNGAEEQRLEKEHKALLSLAKTGEAMRQTEIAQLFLDSSDKTGAGTILLFCGTLMLIAKLAVPLIPGSEPTKKDCGCHSELRHESKPTAGKVEGHG